MTTCVMVVGWKCDGEGMPISELVCGKPAQRIKGIGFAVCTTCYEAACKEIANDFPHRIKKDGP